MIVLTGNSEPLKYNTSGRHQLDTGGYGEVDYNFHPEAGNCQQLPAKTVAFSSDRLAIDRAVYHLQGIGQELYLGERNVTRSMFPALENRHFCIYRTAGDIMTP